MKRSKRRFMTVATHALLNAGLVLNLISCASNETIDSDDVNPDVIHGSYQAKFVAEKNELHACSQFRVGGGTGTTVRLISPSEITMDGRLMDLQDGNDSFINLIGTYYIYKVQNITEPKSQYSFVWTQDDGKTTTENKLQFAGSVGVADPSAGSRHSRASDLIVELEGSALNSGEKFEVRIESGVTPAEGEFSSAWESTSTGRQVRFLSDKLSRLPAGAAKISVSRINRQSVNGHAEAGGSVRSEYVGIPITIDLD